MEEEHNVFDEMADFETKMYQFLDPPGSPEIIPSPDGRRLNESADVHYNNYPGTSSTTASATFYASADASSMYSTLNNGEEEKLQPKWFCTQCNRSFAAQFALDQHRRFKHQGYKIHCRHCPHTSTNGYALFLHVQREHADVEGNGYMNGIKSNTKKAINARRKRRAVKVLTRQPVEQDSGSYATSLMPSAPRAYRAVAPAPAPTNAYQHLNDVGDILQNAIDSVGNGGGGGGGGHYGRKTNGVSPLKGKARKRTTMKIVRNPSLPSLDCDKCGKKFAFHSGLRMHTKMVHSGFRFTCQYCGLHFTNGYAIHRHVNIVHNVIGAVRNSGFSAATPPPAEFDPNVDGEKIIKPKEIVCVMPTDSPTTKIAPSLLTGDDSTNHIRLRLRRKALPSKAISSLEWAMDVESAATTSSATATAHASRRFSAPIAGSSMLDVSDPSSPELNDVSNVVGESLMKVDCSFCPYSTDDLDTLKLHSFKHSAINFTSPNATANSSLVVGDHSLRQCPYCSYCTSQQSSYIVHASSHFTKPTHYGDVSTSAGRRMPIKTSSPSSSSSSTLYRCTYCDRRFQCSIDLVEHEKRHTTRN